MNAPAIAMLPGPLRAENPYITELAPRLGSPIRPFGVKSALWADVALVHWPQMYAKSWRRLATFAVLLRVLRARKRPIVWVAHDLEPHSKGPRSRIAYRLALRFCTHVVALAPSSIERLTGIPGWRDGRDVRVIPHPGYQQTFEGTRQEARERWSLAPDARVFLLFGSMRRNKRPVETARWFSQVAREGDLLVLAGRASDTEVRGALHETAASDPRVRFLEGFISELDLSTLVTAADACFSFFAPGMENSGSVIYALSHGRPVVGSRVGAVADLERTHPEWLHLTPGKAFPAWDTVTSFLSADRQAPPRLPSMEEVSDSFRRLLWEASEGRGSAG